MIAGSLFLMFVAAVMAQKDLSVDCNSDESVTVRWTPSLDLFQKLDPSKALLGNCPPSFMVSEDTLLFYVSLRDCGFIRQVTEDRLTYSNMLIYDQWPELPFISQSVQCVYDSPASTVTPSVEDVTDGQETFIMEIMNSDFGAPAPSSSFTPGSSVPIRAAVESRGHRPLRIYMESCVAATDKDIGRATRVLPIITNAGCLMGSKSGNSSFLERRHPEEIRLYLDTVSFTAGQNIFLHCDLKAWDARSRSLERKACQYLQEQRRWELLDDPSQSYACTCCDSTCFWRSDSSDGVSARKVLGPLVMTEDGSRSDAEHGLSAAPLWLLVVVAVAALVTLKGIVAVSYYLCFWRGGRLGYRPSRDLLTKH